ncbi:MAG: FeS assembly SUF system protein [Thermoprotei archaeon]|nr:MAG: FeS assembly SUF system protein [Thermoprotei archaeon]
MSSNEELRKKVIEVLKDIYDPEIPINIYDLGLVYRVEVRNGSVELDITLTSMGCPLALVLPRHIEENVKSKIPEVKEVKVNLVFNPPWTPLKMTEEGRKRFKELYGYDIVEEWTKSYGRK